MRLPARNNRYVIIGVLALAVVGIACGGGGGNGGGNGSPPPYVEYSTVSAGISHTCALSKAGAAYCWGYNSSGQLGDGTTNPSSKPKLVTGNHTFTAISAGGGHTCGVDSGKLWCWGENTYGQIGLGTLSASVPTPAQVPLASDVVSVSAGMDSTCAITTTDELWCWGHSLNGQLGFGAGVAVGTGGAANGPGESYFSPGKAIATGSNLKQVQNKGDHACAYTAQGTVKCWGMDLFHESGVDANAATRDECFTGANGWPCFLGPQTVTSTAQYNGIGVGEDFTCATTVGYTVDCWGTDQAGQLGVQPTPANCPFPNGMSFACEPLPTAVTGLTGAYDVTAGDDFACAARYPSGTVVACWGNNAHGQLGDGTNNQRATVAPLSVALSSLVLSAGGQHACLVTDGTQSGVPANVIFCWGSNTSGEIGNGTSGADVPAPVRIAEP
jgi:alpha-tubulin suppressor-like RCC1 family protein